MLTTLRRKFIAIAMCSLALVLTIIMVGINTANYINVCHVADERISLIASNGGTFPQDLNADDKPLKDTDNSPKSRGDGSTPPDRKRPEMSAEAPFDTRYFTVTILEDGTISQIDTGRIASASSSDAASYASSLWNKHKKSGFVDSYRYQAVAVTTDSGDTATMYIFLNSERELSTFRTFLLASVGISIAGLLLVFCLVVFFSKKAVKPVAESYEKQKRFITDASHEIKTPLTIIDANTEVIEMTNGENQWTESTRKQIKRLTSLTEKLVFLARMDEESTQLSMQSFCLSDAILDTAEPFTAVAKTKGKTLSVTVEPDVSIKGDEATLRQLVSLLLDNAIKYGTEDSTIRLTFHTVGKNRVLTIWNATEPLERGRHDELFERFYRADESRNSKTGGFGIGLSVAKAIVIAHKGRITAKSTDGASIEFTVTL